MSRCDGDVSRFAFKTSAWRFISSSINLSGFWSDGGDPLSRAFFSLVPVAPLKGALSDLQQAPLAEIRGGEVWEA